ncbi:pentatricopeptide repeat-containing protein 2, mitochondrial-like [Littorina saxatilis]|uniref:Pentatricopeptide repeat-containing protein 2, mitochondrial n=1 Tax=Littorina saxatilis TaxID=31220 RepID=A0AAN9GRY0_9CAEN
MATLSREILRVCCIRPANRCSILGRRFLFSSEILGIENFKRISIYEKDKVLDKTDFVDKLAHNRYAASFRDRQLVHDLVKLIYITEEQSEVALMTDLLRQLSCNRVDTKEPSVDALNGMLNLEGPLSPRRFQVGPLVFRLLHILKYIHTAQMLYHDKELKPLFMNATCHLLLMDMLYEAGRYQEVVSSFTALQQAQVSAKFPPDGTTLAMAALYKLNTPTSSQEMERLVQEAKEADCGLSRRSLLFAAALALRQRNAQCALDISQTDSNSNETIFRNIKVMALAQFGRMEEAIIMMEEGLKEKLSTPTRTFTVYLDTAKAMSEQFTRCRQPPLETKFETVLTGLDEEGLLSPQTVEHFVNRPILRQRRSQTSQSFKTRLKSPLKLRQK